MEYSLTLHGDILEKEASEFVNLYLTNYEEIWKKYIGNIGNNTKAKISNYAFDENRQKFWENCYTVLESAFLSFNIAKSNCFLQPIHTFLEYENFNKNFIAFFAHLGRINDNLISASEILGIYTNKPILKDFYNARNIVIHGKVIPISLDELGIVKIPILNTNEYTSFGWTVNSKSWDEGQEMKYEYVSETCEKTIFELLKVINGVMGEYLQHISDNLKKLEAKIIFEYNNEVYKIGIESPNCMYGINGLGNNLCITKFKVSQSKKDKFDY